MDNDILETLKTSDNTNVDSTGYKELMKTLTDRLTKQSKGISSSATSSLQSEMAKAMADVESARVAGSERIRSEWNRERGYAISDASDMITQAEESRTGFATQVAAMRRLTDTTEKSIRDLDARYQEALLANDATMLSKLSDLRIKKLEFQNQQEQNFFSNMLSVVGLQQREQDRIDEESRFVRSKKFEAAMFDKQVFKQERQQMLSLAAEHGVEVTDGDTIESVIKKIMPTVSRKKALELAELETSISSNRANIARALRGGSEDTSFDDATATAFVLADLQGAEGIMRLIKTPQQARQFIEKKTQMTQKSDARLKEIATTVTNINDFKKKAAADPNVLYTNEKELDVIAKAYEDMWVKAQKSIRKANRPKIDILNELIYGSPSERSLFGK